MNLFPRLSAFRRNHLFILLHLLSFLAVQNVWLPAARADYAEGMSHYRKAWAAYATQDFDQAKRWAEAAVRADGDNAHAHALLGNLAYLSHDLPAARVAWGRSLEIQPQLRDLYDQIAQAEAELEMEKELRPLTIDDLRLAIEGPAGSQSTIDNRKSKIASLAVRVPRSLPPEQAQAILTTLAEAVEELQPYFQHRVDRPLTVLIYPQGRFYEMNHVPTEVMGLFDGKIRIPAPASFPRKGESSIESRTTSDPRFRGDDDRVVLWHEYAHAVVYDLSNGRAPRWLQEGLAQECELLAVRHSPMAKGQRPTAVGESSARAGEDPLEVPAADLTEHDRILIRNIPVRKLLGISDRFGEPAMLPARHFYPAAHGLVRFLLGLRGWDRMRAFLKALGAGQSVEEALLQVYGWEVDGLEKRWRAAAAH